MDNGCAPEAWFGLAKHVEDIYNHTAYFSNCWRTPIESSSGDTPDISGLLMFTFWKPVYYYDPTTDNEKLGRWLGRVTNYGDTMCHWILTKDTTQLVVKSTIKSAVHINRSNLVADLGEAKEEAQVSENSEKPRF